MWPLFPVVGWSLIFEAGLGKGAEMLSRVALCAKHIFFRIACLLTAGFKFTVAAMIICLGTLGTSANAADADQMRQMQQVIDGQRRQLEAQQKQLEAQQKQLDAQAEVLDQVQIQLGDMSNDDKGEDKELEKAVAQTDEPISATPVAKAGPAAAHSEHEEKAAEAAGSDSSSVEVRFGRGDESSGGFRMHEEWSDLDHFPTDIGNDKGIFILSPDRKKQLRIYGSLRARAYWDNQDLRDPWVIDMANTPAAKDSNDDWSYEFETKETRLGIDVDVKDTVGIRMEFDWRGNSDELRVRQMFLRTEHWVIGKNWTAFNTINYLPLSLDYHSTGAAVGIRTEQIKYQNGFGNWKYNVALEDNSPKVNAPDELNAGEDNNFPNLAANIDYSGDWGRVRLAGLLAPNRVRSNVGDDSDLGGGVQAGFRWNINASNVLKGHALYVEGQNSMMADYSRQNLDVIYDPGKNEFRNVESFGGQVGLEHYWRPTLSTTIGGGLTDIDEQDFEPDDAYDKGYKGLLNLIWKPGGKLDGFLVGTEFVYVNRENKDGSDNDINRVIFAVFYDW